MPANAPVSLRYTAQSTLTVPSTYEGLPMWREKGRFRAEEPTGLTHVVVIEVEDDAAPPRGDRSEGVEESRRYITTDGLIVLRIGKGSYRFSDNWTPLGSDDLAAP